MSTEFHPSALGIFLSSVHRARDNTGKRPVANIVSRGLVDQILAETVNIPDDRPCQSHEAQLCGYPVRVVESPRLFALSLDNDFGPDE